MDEAKLADLNHIQDFFNRVDSVRNSASPTKKFHIDHPIGIGVKNFIGWCNDSCEIGSESSNSADDAETLGEAIVALNQLDNSELAAMEAALREDVWGDWCGTEWRQAKQAKRLGPTINIMKNHPENAAFYLVLRHRTDKQKHYRFYFDDDTIAEVDAFKPFTDSAHDNLNQQWHVLISVLAYLDVAHALSSDQHEYHCLYQHFKSRDMGDLSALHLQLLCSPNQPENRRIKLQLVKPKTAPKPWAITYRSEAMNGWLKEALRRLADK